MPPSSQEGLLRATHVALMEKEMDASTPVWVHWTRIRLALDKAQLTTGEPRIIAAGQGSGTTMMTLGELPDWLAANPCTAVVGIEVV